MTSTTYKLMKLTASLSSAADALGELLDTLAAEPGSPEEKGVCDTIAAYRSYLTTDTLAIADVLEAQLSPDLDGYGRLLNRVTEVSSRLASPQSIIEAAGEAGLMAGLADILKLSKRLRWGPRSLFGQA